MDQNKKICMEWIIRDVEAKGLPPFAVGYYKKEDFIAVAYCYDPSQAQFVKNAFVAQATPEDWEWLQKEGSKNNLPELKRRLAQDYNLSLDDAVVNAMLDAVVLDVDRGFAEMELIANKYNDLICPWCGRLHHRTACMNKYNEE